MKRSAPPTNQHVELLSDSSDDERHIAKAAKNIGTTKFLNNDKRRDLIESDFFAQIGGSRPPLLSDDSDDESSSVHLPHSREKKQHEPRSKEATSDEDEKIQSTPPSKMNTTQGDDPSPSSDDEVTRALDLMEKSRTLQRQTTELSFPDMSSSETKSNIPLLEDSKTDSQDKVRVIFKQLIDERTNVLSFAVLGAHKPKRNVILPEGYENQSFRLISEFKVVLNANDRFEKFVKNYSSWIGVRDNEVVLLFGDVRILPLTTPKACELYDWDTLHICHVDYYNYLEKKNAMASSSSPATPFIDKHESINKNTMPMQAAIHDDNDTESIVVKISCRNNQHFRVKIKKNFQLLKIVEYLKSNVKENVLGNWRLLFDGEPIDLNETALSVGLDNDDILDAVFQPLKSD